MEDTWVRARTSSQIEQRTQQILHAAQRLIENHDFDEISMVMIAKEADFTRSNLYRYFTTREEVFLEILRQDLESWIDELPSVLGDVPLSAHDFSKKWINGFLSRTRMNDLLAILSTKLEAGASVTALQTFKTRLVELQRREVPIIQTVLPGLSRSATYRLTMLRGALVVGAYPAMNPTPKQMDAMSLADIPFSAEPYRQMMIDSVMAFLQSLTQIRQ
jgi:TetR/AcrR family transcriptional regulator